MLDKTRPSFGQRPNGPRPAPVRRPAADPQTEPAAPLPAPVMAQASATASAPASPEAPGPEARWAKRAPSRLGAQILHQTLTSPLACTVRDTSSTGVRLELTAQRGGNLSRDRVPDQFTLLMPADRLEVDCEVVWRQGPLVGARYTAPARRAAKPTPPRRPDAPKKPHTSLIKLLINPL